MPLRNAKRVTQGILIWNADAKQDPAATFAAPQEQKVNNVFG
jgi:hypothetical protein